MHIEFLKSGNLFGTEGYEKHKPLKKKKNF